MTILTGERGNPAFYQNIDYAGLLPFFLPKVLIISTGSRIKLVKVPTTSVKEVSHPRALVPPKSLQQKMTNPAMSTREV